MKYDAGRDLFETDDFIPSPSAHMATSGHVDKYSTE